MKNQIDQSNVYVKYLLPEGAQYQSVSDLVSSGVLIDDNGEDIEFADDLLYVKDSTGKFVEL